MIRKLFIQTATILLILLWVYAGVSKMLDFDHFKMEMELQVFGFTTAHVVAYLLPPAEVLLSILLVLDKTAHFGLYFSVALLFVFSVYVTLINFQAFNFVPCACGGFIESMGWHAHLYFNLFFLALNITAIITVKERSAFR